MEKQNLSSRAPHRQEADLRVTQAITVTPQISEREFAEQWIERGPRILLPQRQYQNWLAEVGNFASFEMKQ